MQPCSPRSRRNTLQGPGLTYRCGQFYPCRWCHWNQGDFSLDAVLAAGDRRFFFIWALEYYLKRVVMHLLVVGNALLCVDSHWLRGACSYIITAKLRFEPCLGKAPCTPAGDSHQRVWGCFLALLNAGGRKIGINSSFEATWIVRGTSSAFLTSCSTHRSRLLRLEALGSRSLCCPAPFMSFSEVIPVLCVHFGLRSEMPGTAGWSF